ncbi:hypothetical protein Taro_047125 [Colocasia esculenta]|uniref:RNase H type-1 domain-containing protein n=1 Tax=Colocasia esculenta TaxID=4460 RepID=A0A843X6C6_COLES|nr:hypothetical protein [Colocasia esculenta]
MQSNEDLVGSKVFVSLRIEGRPGGIQGVVIPLRAVKRRPVAAGLFKLVRWIPPESGLVLNVDGANKGNPGFWGGGRCIRDRSGLLLLAFAHFYGSGGSLVTEVRALCDGIQLATEYGLLLSLICSDSAALVTSINTNISPSWVCLRWWREAHSYIHSSRVKVVHTYREANQVADALANLGCKLLSNGRSEKGDSRMVVGCVDAHSLVTVDYSCGFLRFPQFSLVDPPGRLQAGEVLWAVEANRNGHLTTYEMERLEVRKCDLFAGSLHRHLQHLLLEMQNEMEVSKMGS